MPTVRDYLDTIVRLDGADSYISGMRAMGAATGDAAEQQKRLSETYGKLAAGSAAVAGASVGVLAWAVRTTNAFDTYRNKLEVALKSKERADKVFGWAVHYADITPFGTGEVVDATARLEMYGMSAQKWLPLVGDMSGAMGKSVAQGVEAVADAISGGGLERLKEFGIGSMQLKGAGWTGSYQDQAGLDSLKKALQDIMSSRYGGGVDKMATTLAGKFSTLQGNVESLGAAVGNSLKPQLLAAIGAGTRMAEWLRNLSPEAHRAIATLLQFGAVAGTIGAVYFKIMQLRLGMQASAAMVRMAAAQNAAANMEEAAAARGATVAYNEKAEAYIRAAATGGTAAASARAAAAASGAQAAGGWSQFRYAGGKAGWKGQAQTMLAMTGATMAAGDLMMRDNWLDRSGDAAKMVGYVAGMFNPVILGFTMLADVTGRLIDAFTDARQRVANAEAEKGLGIGGGGEGNWRPKTAEEIRKEYEAGKKARTVPSSATLEDYEDIVRTQERLRQAADARRRTQEAVKAATEEAGNAAEMAGLGSEAAKLALDRAKRNAATPDEYAAAAEKYRQRLVKEAEELRAKAELLYHRYMMARPGEERNKLQVESAKAYIDYQRKLDEADRVSSDWAADKADADKKAAEQQAKARADVIDAARAQVGLMETVYGAESQQAKDAHDQVSRLLMAESQAAAATGNKAEATRLATEAIKEYKAAHDDLNASMEKGIAISDAYTEYLTAIGKTGEAERWQREVTAQLHAGRARAAFARGDLSTGYREAAAAEKAARAGDKGKGAGRISGMGDSTGRVGALTAAVGGELPSWVTQGAGTGSLPSPPPMVIPVNDANALPTGATHPRGGSKAAEAMGAASRSGVTVHPLVTVHVYDDEGNRKKQRETRADYYGSFTK